MQNYLETLQNLTIPQKLIYSVADFPALIFHPLEDMQDLQEAKAAFGPIFTGLFTKSDQSTSLLKIAMLLANGGWTLSCLTLRKSGMMRSGKIYLRGSSDSPTTVRDFSLLRTPTAGDREAGLSSHLVIKWIKAGNQIKLIYQCLLSGLTGTQTTLLYEQMMGLDMDWTKIE